ncbi:lipopolysaccharide biosynthesis protein [Pseudarthrobacter sp. fls2-241-R2A-168]|uniref:lipopolysaccharide biosynthesis protein n=1 Tax=Pseudarthrobacter sp. fls2-241-R2A-168 TaxID=3040304 RepID=UPI00255336BF|nr:lipopolysaccharide biosynthesis protein [Pseudarthrobacter sp. fls2-241-R2A-168]
MKRLGLASVQEAGLQPGAQQNTSGATSALAWSVLNTAVARFGTLGIGIVLARLLGPDSYGSFAVAMVALLAVLTINELGVSLAIVRWPEDPKRIAPTVTTISILSSAVLCGAGLAVAPWFADRMGDPGATDVVRVMVCCVLVSGVVATPAALMQRAFDQKTKMFIDQVNVWVGAIVSICLVLIGMGAMSLALGRLAGTLAGGLLFVLKSPLPVRMGLDRRVLKPLLRFGLPLAGTSIIVFCVGYLDQLVTGSMLGSVMLGMYVLAFNLSSWPVTMFSQPLRSVAPVVLARLQHDPEKMRSTVMALIGVLACVVFPAIAFLAAESETIVRIVYGDVWAGASAALFWLAMVAGLRILFELIYDYLVVAGMTGSIMSIQVCWLMALIPALFLGATAGIAGVAMAQFVVVAALVLPLYLWRLRAVGVRPLRLLRQLVLPACASALLFAAPALFGQMELAVPFALLLSATAAAFVTAGLLWFKRADVAILKKLGRSGGLADHQQ